MALTVLPADLWGGKEIRHQWPRTESVTLCKEAAIKNPQWGLESFQVGEHMEIWGEAGAQGGHGSASPFPQLAPRITFISAFRSVSFYKKLVLQLVKCLPGFCEWFWPFN